MLVLLLALACDPAAPPVDPDLSAFTRQQIEQQVVALTQQNRQILAELAALRERVGLLEGADAELAGAIEQVQVGGVDALAVRVDAAETSLTSLSASFRTLEAADLITRMGTVEARQAGLVSSVAMHASELAKLGVLDDDSDIDLRAMRDAAVQHGVIPVTDDSDTLDFRLRAAEATGAALDVRLTHLQDDYDTVVLDLAIVNDDIDQLTGRLTRVEDDQDAFVAQLATVIDDYDTLSLDLAALHDDVDFVSRAVTALNDDVDTLSVSVADAALATCKLEDAVRGTLSGRLLFCGSDELCVDTGTDVVPWSTWAATLTAGLDADTCAP